MTDSTVPQQPIPSVVIVAPAAEMLDMWLEILQRLDEVPSIQLTDLKDAATAVARWRPMALLVEQVLFEFDAPEFAALARDVGAEVIVVDTAAGKESIAALVLPKLADTLAKWRADQDQNTRPNS
jgi:hypothetical protein